MRPSIRRIVTGLAEDGRSAIVSDGPSPAERLVAARPGYRVTNLWCTARGTHPDAEDAIASQSGVLPPAGGTVLRIIDVPPEPDDEQARRQAVDETFRSMFPDAHRGHGETARIHPGMHKTATVDYALVLEGELTAILEAGETVLRAGDVLIQRGTNHAWANRSGRPVRVAFILVDPS